MIEFCKFIRFRPIFRPRR